LNTALHTKLSTILRTLGFAWHWGASESSGLVGFNETVEDLHSA